MKIEAAAFWIVLNLLLWAEPGWAAGPVALRADERGVTVETGTLETRVEFWSAGVIRVIHRPSGGLPEAASLAVIAKPGKVKWALYHKPGLYVLKTAAAEIDVDKMTGAVAFLDARGAPMLAEVSGGTSFPTVAASGTNWDGTRQEFRLDPGEAIYGLGQHQQGVMNYAGSAVHLLQENREVAVPVLLSSKGYALLWDNPAVTTVDVGRAEKGKLTWSSEDGSTVDYYFFAGPEPDQAIAEYRWLTGEAPMFGKWAWGFWQCRERYAKQEEILGVAAKYRAMGVPIDGIIQDWQYWPPLNQVTAEGGWGSHEFERARYPDPAAMVKTLHDENFHIIISVWAKFDVTNNGVSIENLKQLEAVNGALKPTIKYVYPKGQGKWYDPFNEKAREVYWKDVSTHLFTFGLDGWWLDASEPELSGSWGEFRTFATAQGPGARVFNAYPLVHTGGVYQGQRAETSDKRVFILTRSAYAGQQRNAAVTWSGDIQGTWDVFRKQIPAGLNFTASGIPYWNTDIGGFFGGDPADPKYAELFTRWFQFGSFCPMFRVHGTGKPKELWRFDQATQEVMKNFIKLRYHLLPYTYSVAWMVTHEGYTMMRPLVMDFRKDPQIQNIADQFLFGPSLMVCPVVQPGVTSRSVYLPAGTGWVDFWTGKSYDGGQKIDAPATIDKMPIYVKAGAILPYGPEIQYAAEQTGAPLTLRIYRGADGDFTLYEDEGDGYNYEKGMYATIPIHWNDRAKKLTLGKRSGAFPGMLSERTIHVAWVSPGKDSGVSSASEAFVEIRYDGSEQTIQLRGGYP